jgi:hypothetical protein
MKKALIPILLVISVACFGQSKCDRSTSMTADFTFQSNTGMSKLNASVNFGLSTMNKSGERYNHISVMAGVRIYDTDAMQKSGDKSTNVFITPTATMLYKYRFNGYESNVVHALGITAGGKNYLEASYRVYAAPRSNSFATVGGIISYSNMQGFTIGFSLMGFL